MNESNKLREADEFESRESYVEYIYNTARDDTNNTIIRRLNRQIRKDWFLRPMLDALILDEQLYLYSLVNDKIKLRTIEKLSVLTLFTNTMTKSVNLINEIFNRNIITLRQYILYLVVNDKLSSINYFLFKFTPHPFEIRNIMNEIDEDNYYATVLRKYIKKSILSQI